MLELVLFSLLNGLVFATLSTLFFVPVVLSAIGYHPPAPIDVLEPAKGTP